MKFEMNTFEKGVLELKVKGLTQPELKRGFIADFKERIGLMWDYIEYLEKDEKGKGLFLVYKFTFKDDEFYIKLKDSDLTIIGQNTKGLNDAYVASALDSLITIFDELNMVYYIEAIPIVIEKINYDMKISNKNKSEKFVIEI